MNKNSCIICLFALCLAAWSLNGCAATQLMDAQSQVRQSFTSGDIKQSRALMQRYEDQVYRTNDQVLRDLEMGALLYYSGEWEESLNRMQQAEREIDRLFGVSVQRNLRALVLNDAQLEYQGEDYEDVMINVFNALSYVQLNDYEAALVESRRISFKLENLAIRYDGLVESLSRRDTTEVDTNPGWERGSTNVEASAFGHYLSYVLNANQGRQDAARIEYDRFRQVYSRHYGNWSPSPVESSGNRLMSRNAGYPPAGNTLLLAFGGRAPEKEARELRIYSDDLSTYIKYAVPVLDTYDSRVQRVEAVINDTLQIQLPLLDDFSRMAEEVFQVRKPIIYTRAIVRSTLKFLSSKAAQSAVESEYGEAAGKLTGVLGSLFTEVSEVADLRAWQTMPGQVYGFSVDLPPGEHQLRIRYLGRGGQLLFEQERAVQRGEGQRELTLYDAFYWN
jgi:hypothetical protein